MKLAIDEQQAVASADALDRIAEATERALEQHIAPRLGAVKRALEVDCREGRWSLWLGDRARSVRALDASADRIAQAQTRAAAAGLTRVQFECRAPDQALPEGCFDLVVRLAVDAPINGGPSGAVLLSRLTDAVAEGGHLLACVDGSVLKEGQAQLEPVERFPLPQVHSQIATPLNLVLWRKVSATSSSPLDVDEGSHVNSTAVVPTDVPAVDHLPPETTLQRLADQQDRQSEVLLSIGNFLCDLGERLQQIEARVGQAPAVDLKPLMARLDRLESTLHWSARQPRDPACGPIRVAFLIHHAAAWPALRGIVDAMQADPGFEPLLISLPHRFPMLGQLGGESDVHQMLVEQGYPHVRVPDADAEQALERLKQLNPQVVFRQSPWDNDVPACLNAQNLSFTKLCYVPYGYMTAKIEKQQFDQTYHRLCWRIFCPDEAHQQLFAGHNLQAGRNCRVTGYPKFDHLLRHREGVGHWPVNKARPQSFRLIWAPHFSYEGSWLRFGVFDRMAEQMLAFTASQPQLEVVLRPHPAMREAMAAAPSDSFLGLFRDRWAALPNAGLSTEQEYADLFAASHALLTDGLSFFSEYQLFDKPLIFWERQGHAGFNLAGERLLDGMYRLHTFDGFKALLSSLAKGREDKDVVAARKRVAAAVHPYPGEAARRILDVIRNDITRG